MHNKSFSLLGIVSCILYISNVIHSPTVLICILHLECTKVVSYNPVHVYVYSIQQYVIKFVRDLRQVGGFLRVLLFPPPIKLSVTI